MQTFKKTERLRGKKQIDDVFKTGKTIRVFPLLAKWITKTEAKISPILGEKLARSAPLQIAISVPKRNVKRAVDRNRIKRQIRESYRKNKSLLLAELEKQNKNVSLLVIYSGPPKAEYREIESKIILLLQRLIKEDESTGR